MEVTDYTNDQWIEWISAKTEEEISTFFRSMRESATINAIEALNDLKTDLQVEVEEEPTVTGYEMGDYGNI